MLLIGDDWAEDHHDVEVQDESGRKLAAVNLPEGVTGTARLHGLVARHGGEDLDPAEVVVGIEIDRGSWVQALIASGYQVFAINPRQVNRFKERYASCGAKSDKGDAHALADMVRIDRARLRAVAGDSEAAQAVKDPGARSHTGPEGHEPPTGLYDEGNGQQGAYNSTVDTALAAEPRWPPAIVAESGLP